MSKVAYQMDGSRPRKDYFPMMRSQHAQNLHNDSKSGSLDIINRILCDVLGAVKA